MRVLEAKAPARAGEGPGRTGRAPSLAAHFDSTQRTKCVYDQCGRTVDTSPHEKV